mmetsp:Transcript_41890/g.89927  ORF Transcript_41890/g.89927 Transcript_41890/m.89927 type:complete len:160 (-) Transcript_41890:78-557(-)
MGGKAARAMDGERLLLLRLLPRKLLRVLLPSSPEKSPKLRLLPVPLKWLGLWPMLGGLGWPPEPLGEPFVVDKCFAELLLLHGEPLVLMSLGGLDCPEGGRAGGEETENDIFVGSGVVDYCRIRTLQDGNGNGDAKGCNREGEGRKQSFRTPLDVARIC